MRLDEKRLSEERLERAWPPSSRDAAIIAFGPLAVPLHFARTRGHFRSLRGVAGYPAGLALGILVAGLVLGATEYALEGVAWLCGLPLE